MKFPELCERLINETGRAEVTSNAYLGLGTPTMEGLILWVHDDVFEVGMCSRPIPSPPTSPGSPTPVVSSSASATAGSGLAHYAAAKAGVIALVKSLALEVSARGVLVNAIAPGPVETPLVDGISAEWKAAKRAELPLGRFGLPEEVAPAALLLASDPGGNLFVGQTLGPNSGDVMP